MRTDHLHSHTTHLSFSSLVAFSPLPVMRKQSLLTFPPFPSVYTARRVDTNAKKLLFCHVFLMLLFLLCPTPLTVVWQTCSFSREFLIEHFFFRFKPISKPKYDYFLDLISQIYVSSRWGRFASLCQHNRSELSRWQHFQPFFHFSYYFASMKRVRQSCSRCTIRSAIR